MPLDLFGPRCSYRAPDGQICPHPPEENKDTCIYHLPRASQHLNAAEFSERIQELIKEENAYLKGFIYPVGFRLNPKGLLVDKKERNHINAVNEIDISFSDFVDAQFSSTTFNEKFTARNLKIEGDFELLECHFKNDAIFDQTEFIGEITFNSIFDGLARFHSCNFHSRSEFRGSFYGKAHFNRSVFHDGVTFRGKRTISAKSGSGVIATLQQNVIEAKKPFPENIKHLQQILTFFYKRAVRFCLIIKSKLNQQLVNRYQRISSCLRGYLEICKNFVRFECFQSPAYSDDVQIESLFHDEVNLQEVDYRRPERVNFFNVDLTKARVIGTDFTGIQFYDVKWYQPDLKRNGLYEEIEQKNSNDPDTERFKRPQLEKAYRNIRVSLESQKEFDTASDFLIGELNHKLLQKPCYKRHTSILGLYKLLSLFGTSHSRIIFIWFFILILPHFFITASINDIALLSQETFEVILRTLKIATLQKTQEAENINIYQGYADLILRFLSPASLALLALTIRARIKRF